MLLRDYLNVKYGIKKHNVFAHEIGKLPQTVNRWCMLGATIDEKGRIYSGSAQSRLLITIIRDKCPKH